MELARPLKREREDDGVDGPVEDGQEQPKFRRTEDSAEFQPEQQNTFVSDPAPVPDVPSPAEVPQEVPGEVPATGSYVAPPPSMVVPPTTYTATQPSTPLPSLQPSSVLPPSSPGPEDVTSPTSLAQAQGIPHGSASHAAEHIAHMQAGTPSAAANSVKQVKFENALDFLDQVKLQFANQPKVYNQFLDIMKDFKAQCIDTPGVIARVSELFKGHKNLILGFNTFLPPGYKIEYVPDDESDSMSSGNFIVTQPPPAVPLPAVPQPARKQPEFDHARNYVKKIKMRFQNQPQTYKQFLEILHTYHKEQHTIKDVYEQVAKLFATHTDLLDEFTQFLPDPLAQAPPLPVFAAAQGARPKKARPKIKEAKEREHHHREQIHRELEREREREREQREREREAQLERQREREAQREREKLLRKEQRKKQRQAAGPQEEPKLVPNGSYEELNFFFRVRQRLNNQQLYMEFLKCLNLFSNNVISRLELVLLVKDILSRHRDLFDWFKQFIGFDDPSIEFMEKQDERPSTGRSTADIDFKTCKRYGPSYRALPKNFPQPICSGRTELCNQVLNDQWVSVPVGSEEGVFRNQRKNQYEEMLFKCEDDRFELDLIIEQNAATIRSLESVMKQLGDASDATGNSFKIDVTLDIVNLRSIERIYGEKGTEVCDMMYENPATVIPVILKRLRQKDVEWIRARQEWNKIWREVNEKNYYKSLDYQSFAFKQADRKNLQPKTLIAEIKQKYQQDLKRARALLAPKADEERQNEHEIDADSAAAADGKAEEAPIENGAEEPSDSTPAAPSVPGAPLMPLDRPQPHLVFNFDDQRLLNDAIGLVLFSFEKANGSSKSEFRTEFSKVEVFFNDFVRKFLFLEPAASSSSPQGAPAEDLAAAVSAAAKSSDPVPMAEDRVPADEEREATAGSAPDAEAPAASFGESAESGTAAAAPAESASPSAAPAAEPMSVEAPSSSQAATVPESAPAEPDAAQPPAQSVQRQTFYGNDPFYVFFRLLAIVYDRLRRAQELAASNQLTSEYHYILNPSKRANVEDPTSKYDTFYKSLCAVIAGSKESGAFEDDCRTWFGMQSYHLFTIDKALHNAVKALLAMLSDDLSTDLLKLWSHQNVVPAASRDVVYYSNVVQQLDNERCFRLRSSVSNQQRELSVLMLTPSHTPPEYVGIPLEKHTKWSQYVSNYLQSEETHVDPKKNHVFLERNQKKAPRTLDEAQENVVAENNLECRICLSTYRLFYVEKTEDFLYRRGTLSHAAKHGEQTKSRQPAGARVQSVVDRLAKAAGSEGLIPGATS